MSETKKQNGKLLFKILGGVVLLALLAAIAILYAVFREKPVQGAKQIEIEVINDKAEKKSYELHTDVEYLRQAMDEVKGFSYSGDESEYGLMLSHVNGLRALYAEDGAYWAVYVNGEYAMNGIDTQPVKDGEVYRFEYTKAE